MSDLFDVSNELKNNKVLKQSVLNKVIIVLLVVNIIITLSFGIIVLSTTSENKLSNKNVSSISIESTDKIIEQIVGYYNDNKLESLYSMFGEYAKTKVSLTETVQSLGKLSILGKISNYTFLNSKDLGDDAIGKWYEVNYSALFDSGPGTLKINFLERNGILEIVGFNFNVSKLN